MGGYSVGIVGCGGMGRSHASSYLSIEGVEVNACSDINPINLNAFSERYNVARKYEDYREMMKAGGLDIVSVCTWPKTHCEITIEAARSGVRGIMCEKPLAVNLGEADKMIDACQKDGVVLAVGHEHRFDPQSVKARSVIESGEIGRPELIWGHCSLDLMNNGTHVIDLVNYLNMDSKATWVMGQVDRSRKRLGAANHPDMYVEDMAIGHVKYQNGVEAVIELGEYAPQNFEFHVIGEKGQVEVNSPQAPLRIVGISGIQCPELPNDGDNVRMELIELIRAMEGGREHLSSGSRGRATLEIIMALFESSRRRAVIKLPLSIKENPLEEMIKGDLI